MRRLHYELWQDDLDPTVVEAVRVAAGGAEVHVRGDWLGLRMPYRQGTLIVIGSATPLSNEGLSDPATARFVFRTLVGPAQGQVAVGPTSHHLGRHGGRPLRVA